MDDLYKSFILKMLQAETLVFVIKPFNTVQSPGGNDL